MCVSHMYALCTSNRITLTFYMAAIYYKKLSPTAQLERMSRAIRNTLQQNIFEVSTDINVETLHTYNFDRICFKSIVYIKAIH